jgi:AAA domain, putative AbiEii toxin, Type IV TA system
VAGVGGVDVGADPVRARRLVAVVPQRNNLDRSLMHAPQVLFLDEPTTGLDPAARLFVWDRVADLKARGVTIVLTTHDMLPIGVWILGSIPWRPSGLPLFVTVLPLGCLVGSCLGMIMGTAVPPTASTSCSPWS